MPKYVVELSDSDGKSCRVRLSLPFVKKNTDTSNSTWRALDEGFIKFRSGGCAAVSATGKEEWFVGAIPSPIFTLGLKMAKSCLYIVCVQNTVTKYGSTIYPQENWRRYCWGESLINRGKVLWNRTA